VIFRDGDEVNVLLVDLPPRVRGFTSQNDQGEYCILLNAKDDQETLRRTYQHEYDEHIAKGDFIRKSKVDEVEAKRHDL
jgi:hypothetical protein